MVLRNAGKYIKEHRKRQQDPFLWPDYITGLPDKPAIIKKIEEAYKKSSRSSIGFVRISNIQPYLSKYGADKHLDIIQWAAAILKSASEKRNAFVGVFNTHDFIVIAPKDKYDAIIKEASEAFKKKALDFYSDADRKKGGLLAYRGAGADVSVGFMEFVSSRLGSPANGKIPRGKALQHLERACTDIEMAGK